MLELPDPLFQKVKHAAASQGVSPERFIVTVVEKNLPPSDETDLKEGKEKRVQLPLIESKKPGVLRLTNADIEELLA